MPRSGSPRASGASLKPLRIGKERVFPGERRRIMLDVASLYDYTPLNIPIEVVRGKAPGPVLFICAAVHGDEINGVEIIKRLLQRSSLERIKGTLIAVPVVNVFGFNAKTRYLPDRRDLNRCFPGTREGSLASQIAHVLMKEIVEHCTHGIDLHTGALNRSNLPQIRACLDDPDTDALARGFGVPVVIHSELRDGSLREAARKAKVISLLFEGGEALRFEENVVKVGLRGCLSVMRNIGMLPPVKRKGTAATKTYVSTTTYWVRAPHSGSFRAYRKLGDHVQDGEILAVVSGPFGQDPYEVKAEEGGIVVGLSTIPLVNKGDAMFHIAAFRDSRRVKRAIDLLDDSL